MISLMLGVVLGNVLQGMPIGADHEFQGDWLEFINPYAILVGVTTVALFMMHGAIYLLLKTQGRLFAKLTILVKRGILFFVISFGLMTLYTMLYIPHLSNDFKSQPSLFIFPLIAFLSIANIPRLTFKRRFRWAFIFSALTIASLLALVAIEVFPVLLRSSTDPAYHLTIYNSASSEKSMGIMLLIAAIGAPLVAAYTIFVYKTFAGKVELDETSY